MCRIAARPGAPVPLYPNVAADDSNIAASDGNVSASVYVDRACVVLTAALPKARNGYEVFTIEECARVGHGAARRNRQCSAKGILEFVQSALRAEQQYGVTELECELQGIAAAPWPQYRNVIDRVFIDGCAVSKYGFECRLDADAVGSRIYCAVNVAWHDGIQFFDCLVDDKTKYSEQVVIV